jgi:hypothetical protein
MSVGAEYADQSGGAQYRRETLDEQARRRGIRPVRTVDDMARDDVFESDEELDAFLAHLYAERHANLAQWLWVIVVVDLASGTEYDEVC